MNILELDGIFKDVIKIRADDVLYEQRKHQVGSATNQAALTLNRYVQEHPLRQIDFVKDGGLNTIECIEKISSLDSLYQILRSYSAPKLPYFKSELAAVVEMLDVREEYRIASFNLSEESLQHLPDYKSRVSLLRNWNYIGDHGGVQLKGMQPYNLYIFVIHIYLTEHYRTLDFLNHIRNLDVLTSNHRVKRNQCNINVVINIIYQLVVSASLRRSKPAHDMCSLSAIKRSA